MASTKDATHLPFEVDGRHIVLIDVLYTGRTTRAVINELFDFGRPASVTLAVLVDAWRAPVAHRASLLGCRITLPPRSAGFPGPRRRWPFPIPFRGV